jgi:hypothetical protein
MLMIDDNSSESTQQIRSSKYQKQHLSSLIHHEEARCLQEMTFQTQRNQLPVLRFQKQKHCEEIIMIDGIKV